MWYWTSARVATLYERGLLDVEQPFLHESITDDGVFASEISSKTQVDTFDAVVSKVAGRSYIRGFHQFVVDKRDLMPEGFSL